MKQKILASIVALMMTVSLYAADAEYYNFTPSPEGDYANITTNTLWVSGVISALPDLSSPPLRLEDLKPLYIPQEIRVTNELLKPYSSKSYDRMSNFISFKSDKAEFKFDNHNLSGGLFFYNSFNGLVFNNSNEPISLRSRGNIYLQPGVNPAYNSALGSDNSPNWEFVNNPGNSGKVKLVGEKLSVPRIYWGESGTLWSLGQGTTLSTKDNLYLRTSNQVSTGFIIEDDDKKTLMSVRDSDGATYIKGDLDITGGYDEQESKPIVPPGLIIGFVGDSLPYGNEWVLCNGQVVNGVPTPDLRNNYFRSAPEAITTLVNGNNRHPALGKNRHQHYITQAQFNYSINHDHSSINGFVPLLSGPNTHGAVLWDEPSKKAYFNAGSSAYHGPYRAFSIKESYGANTLGLPMIHAHIMGACGKKVSYDLPIHRQSVTVPADRKISNTNSENEQELPLYAKVAFLMKT